MRSTFSGFEAVRKALMASQKGLDVTGQNIANINTEGYSRQRVDLASITADRGSSTYAITKGESQGLGVEITGISQIRDQFLDVRYRENSSGMGKLDAKLAVLQDIENVLDEVSTDGLNSRLADFMDELQEYANNPEAVEFATVFRSAAQKVLEVLNQYSKQLNEAREQEVYEITSITKGLNTLASRVAQCNNEIRNAKLQGYSANELMDERNLLLDKISAYSDVTITNHEDGGVSVRIDGQFLVNATQQDKTKELSVKDQDGEISILWNDGTTANITNGKIAGYLEGLNGKGIFATAQDSASEQQSGLRYYQISLDQFSAQFADTFNKINDTTGVEKLFVGQNGGAITAGTIQISDGWQDDVQYLKTSTVEPFEEGRNDNLLRMVDALNQDKSITTYFSGTFEEFATALMSDMAVEVSYTEDMQKAAQTVLETLEGQRESIRGVSLDEESISIVRYQKSYTAAARVMTAMDEMLDVIINELGLAGR